MLNEMFVTIFTLWTTVPTLHISYFQSQTMYHMITYSISHHPRNPYVYVLVTKPLLVATHPMGDSLLITMDIRSVSVSQFSVPPCWLTILRSHDHTLTNDIYNVMFIESFKCSYNIINM